MSSTHLSREEPSGGVGRKRLHTQRESINAIFYLPVSGCAWRLLPHDLPACEPSIITAVFGAWMARGNVCTLARSPPARHPAARGPGHPAKTSPAGSAHPPLCPSHGSAIISSTRCQSPSPSATWASHRSEGWVRGQQTMGIMRTVGGPHAKPLFSYACGHIPFIPVASRCGGITLLVTNLRYGDLG